MAPKEGSSHHPTHPGSPELDGVGLDQYLTLPKIITGLLVEQRNYRAGIDGLIFQLQERPELAGAAVELLNQLSISAEASKGLIRAMEQLPESAQEVIVFSPVTLSGPSLVLESKPPLVLVKGREEEVEVEMALREEERVVPREEEEERVVEELSSRPDENTREGMITLLRERKIVSVRFLARAWGITPTAARFWIVSFYQRRGVDLLENRKRRN